MEEKPPPQSGKITPSNDVGKGAPQTCLACESSLPKSACLGLTPHSHSLSIAKLCQGPPHLLSKSQKTKHHKTKNSLPPPHSLLTSL